METWTAQQIGSSHGAYSGREICFTISKKTIEGTLTRSDLPGDTVTRLVVDGAQYVLANSTPVTVL